jgi:multiple sugar transport system permease protein
MNRRSLIVRYVSLGTATALAFFPLYWMFMTSIKPQSEWLATPPVWLTSEPTLQNYAVALDLQAIGLQGVTVADQGPAIGPLFNSFVIATTATVLAMVFGVMAAWAISRYRIGGNSLPLSLLAPQMFPPIAIALPLMIMYTTLGLLNTRIGLIIAYTGFSLPFTVWMSKSFIDEVPVELEEAGVMDGLSRRQTLRKITFPMIKGGLGATFLFVFILNWSEYVIALTLTRNMDTVPVYIAKLFTATEGSLFGVMGAVAVISVVPMIIIGYAIQDYLARGFTFGVIRE